ncbi:hypothetical protein TNIN_259311 [Trichonephila inaurata madagascariensis]|uniref:Uncharacterized protein n=1 Tax=Trichonephila inaurata madagascariensis TaxID=2747483 RepID=A0A8X6XJB7_9ARAC|nr:hypothetical protein TNIN_259311 [Trichonephila inaurata madagascariensis]
MQEYRARKKNYLQSICDSPSVVHHQDDEILHVDDNLNKSREFVGLPCQDIKATRKKTSAERMRDYRTRKKARIYNLLVILLQFFVIKKMKFY